MDKITQPAPLGEAVARKQLTERLINRASKAISRAWLSGGHPISSSALIRCLGFRDKRKSVQVAVLSMLADTIPASLIRQG